MLTKLHLELTSRCVLSCPGCPRTWFAQTFKKPVPKVDLNLDDLRQFLDCETGKNITHFHLESNHGDSIYYPQLLEFIKEWRDTKTFHIVTNGSHMKLEFWHELNSLLTANDQITFSVDGLRDTNETYRINSKWDSVMTAIDVISAGPVQLHWKTIAFSHNQDQLEEIKQLAHSKGATFNVIKSHRFGDNSLIPEAELVDHNKTYDIAKTHFNITPQCNSGGQLYISADGFCWPCCWISSYFTLHKTSLWQSRKQWTLKSNSLDQILLNTQDFAKEISQQPKTAHSVCKMMCGTD